MTLKPFENTSQAKSIKISSPNPTLAQAPRVGNAARFCSSQERLQWVLESTGFEVTMLSLLEKADCSIVNEVLVSDLDLPPQRPAPAGQVRWEMWDQAAKQGCVSGASLAQARVRIRSHAESAPVSVGMDRQVLLRRLGPPER